MNVYLLLQMWMCARCKYISPWMRTSCYRCECVPVANIYLMNVYFPLGMWMCAHCKYISCDVVTVISLSTSYIPSPSKWENSSLIDIFYVILTACVSQQWRKSKEVVWWHSCHPLWAVAELYEGEGRWPHGSPHGVHASTHTWKNTGKNTGKNARKMRADQHSKTTTLPFLLDKGLTCGVATAKFLILVFYLCF